MNQNNLFILAGNNSYDNRGCEAITRGTVEIIKRHFKDPNFLAISYFQNRDQLEKQRADETDRSITHEQISPVRLHRLMQLSSQPVFTNFFSRIVYKGMVPFLEQAQAVLSVGGDNCSLYYGKPIWFTLLNDLVLTYKKPIIIWGASIGPFDQMPYYEKYIIEHLKKVSGIFVREEISLAYLAKHGIKENVFLMADPAFLLKPVKPRMDQDIEDGAIGLNLSPLMAKYVTDADIRKWVILAKEIVQEAHKATKRKIYLIPHETSPHTNDYIFLKKVCSLLNDVNVVLIPNKYNAAETKYIIGKMSVFAGARTHSTIAAISMGVPTVSLVYSIKAVGINNDIFGDDRYCVYPQECNPVAIANKIKDVLGEADHIKERLKEAIPKAVNSASMAGMQLKGILNR